MHFTASATDPDLPANELRFTLFGAPEGASIDPATGFFTWTPNASVAVGAYSFVVQVTDDGPIALSDEQVVTITVTESDVSTETTTAVSSSLVSATYGDSLTFTATVSANSSGSGTPTGTIQFLIDGANFGSDVGLLDGSATSPSIDFLSAGTHVILAVYSGDEKFTASTSDPLDQSVLRAALTVTADNEDIGHGDPLPTLTWTFTGFVNGESRRNRGRRS